MSDTATQSPYRDQSWLEECFQNLVASHFPDLPQGFPIRVCFGSPTKNRFGSISARNGTTLIRLNALFADPEVPLYVVQETLAHELAHYVHGFGSGLPQRYEHPHRGGVVEQELFQRGLKETHLQAEAWHKSHWRNFYASRCTAQVEQTATRQSEQSDRWRQFLEQSICRSHAELMRLWEEQKRLLKVSQTPKIEKVDWLHATTRQTAPSYYNPAQKRLTLHGLLADKRVPESILRFELSYWILRFEIGGNIQAIQKYLEQQKMAILLSDTIQWRQSAWTRFRNRHHPLQF